MFQLERKFHHKFISCPIFKTRRYNTSKICKSLKRSEIPTASNEISSACIENTEISLSFKVFHITIAISGIKQFMSFSCQEQGNTRIAIAYQESHFHYKNFWVRFMENSDSELRFVPKEAKRHYTSSQFSSCRFFPSFLIPAIPTWKASLWGTKVDTIIDKMSTVTNVEIILKLCSLEKFGSRKCHTRRFSSNECVRLQTGTVHFIDKSCSRQPEFV